MNLKEKTQLKLEILQDIRSCFDLNIGLNNNDCYTFFSSSKLEKIIEKYKYILEGMDYNEN